MTDNTHRLRVVIRLRPPMQRLLSHGLLGGSYRQMMPVIIKYISDNKLQLCASSSALCHRDPDRSRGIFQLDEALLQLLTISDSSWGSGNRSQPLMMSYQELSQRVQAGILGSPFVMADNNQLGRPLHPDAIARG